MNLKKLKQKNIKFFTILKVIGVIVGGGILLMILSSLSNNFDGPTLNKIGGGFAPSMQSYDGYDDMEADYAMEESARLSMGANTSMPSPIPPSTGTTGETAEDYEVTEYNTTIETTNLEEDCQNFAELKKLEYVIFENQYSHDRGCNYTFKVKNENADEILNIIKAYDPKNFNESTYSIKRTVDYLTDESEIITNKRDSIEQTLQEALDAYDEIAELATRNQDTESLAKIISSKLELVERMSRERINANTQLDRLAKNRAEQLDRLEYTRFYVNIVEDKYIDVKNIKNSWKNAVKDFFRDINSIAQQLTVQLLVLVLVIAQYTLYVFILVYVAKHVWKGVKYIWKK